MNESVAVVLGRGYVASIDVEDVERVSQQSWRAVVDPRSDRVYARATMRGVSPPRDISPHRWLMDVPIGMEIDHIDGDGLNCRRSNLRVATPSQHLASRRLISRSNTSGYRGVYWNKKDRCWRAVITQNGQEIDIGEFARLNYPANVVTPTGNGGGHGARS